MLTSAEVKKVSRAMGADLVSIGSIDRWEGAPIQMDPRQIMPDAKSVIGFGFRIMRGSLRGLEEGTFFSNYSSMGYGGLNWLYIPHAMINIAKFIEDHGYEAVPYGHLSPWRAISNDGHMRENFSRPVEPGKASPDVMIHLRIAAFLCGLGEIGYSKMFLTPEFGPRQRLGVMITEAELEPDPIYDGPQLCDRCMECVEECPAGALDPDNTVKVTIAGRELEWNDIDCDRCGLYFRGGAYTEDGEEGSYLKAEGRDDVKPSPISPFYTKPNNIYIHGQAICGAKGCTRACMIHLEERGVLKNEFHAPFRKKKLWRVDWDEEPEYVQEPGELPPDYQRE
ncbi:MAG: 4Fe-4S binding protein [Armatimonadota bacterium]